MLRRPGVEVGVGSVGSILPLEPTPYTYMVVGYAPWGPVNTPVGIGSLRQAIQVFGEHRGLSGFQLPLALHHYFQFAGELGRAQVVRGFNLGEDETLDDYTASVNILDNTVGTPGTLLTVKAAFPGAWGNSFRVDVAPGRQSGEYALILWGRYRPEVFYWRNDASAMAAAVAEFNKLADQLASDFRLELPGSFNANPPKADKINTSTPVRPSSLAYSLTGGADSASMTVGPLIGGIDPVTGPYGLEALADKRFKTGIVDLYGFSGASALIAIDTHCTRFRRWGLRNLCTTGVLAINTVTSNKAAAPSGSYSSDYWPWVYDIDGNLVPVTPFVAALAARKISRLDREGGVKASITGILPIQGIERANGREIIGDMEAELLFDANVNWVRLTPKGYRLEAQKLSTPEGQTSRVSHRITLNTFAYMIEEVLEEYRDIVIPKGGSAQGAIISAVKDVLSPYEAGKPYPQGDSIYGSSVVVDKTTNTDLRQEMLRVEVYVQLPPHAERILVSMTHIPLQ